MSAPVDVEEESVVEDIAVAPLTPRLESVPTDVMFGCAAVASVPVNVPAATSSLTVSDESVPTDVMFGCAAVETVP